MGCVNLGWKYLKTRQNYKIKTPDFFTKNFPPFAIDGELWIARNNLMKFQL